MGEVQNTSDTPVGDSSAKLQSHALTRRSFVVGAGAMGALAACGGLGLIGCAPHNEQVEGEPTESYDIVIVGTGGAGLAAAISD